jgi:hypothetical protein
MVSTPARSPPEKEDAILDELDTLWYEMTDEEHKLLDEEI